MQMQIAHFKVLTQRSYILNSDGAAKKQILFSGTPFWILSLEINKFKLINSQFHFTLTP